MPGPTRSRTRISCTPASFASTPSLTRSGNIRSSSAVLLTDHLVFRLVCKHSMCYVCIRLWFETAWGCPQCKQKVTKKPVRDDDEAAAINADCGAWDQSRVAYSWDGLIFPGARQLTQ
jgi:hypothetical protein